MYTYTNTRELTYIYIILWSSGIPLLYDITVIQMSHMSYSIYTIHTIYYSI